MNRSTERILTTHVGSLPRPADLLEMMAARQKDRPSDERAFAGRMRTAVAEIVRRQVECGVDIVSDGEQSKPGFAAYVDERLSGFESRPLRPGERPVISWGDMEDFPEYAASQQGSSNYPKEYTASQQGSPNDPNVGASTVSVCTGPVAYRDDSAVQRDIANFKAALQEVECADAFLPAISLGVIEHNHRNEYYPSTEAFLYALADAMKEEYAAIAASGLLVQVDAPDLPDEFHRHFPPLTVEEYRKFAALRVEALNHALAGIPGEQIRFHACWGNYEGPHHRDVPLRDIVDLILQVRAGGYVIEAANPRHEHEWRVWADVKLPEGKILIPGVIDTTTNFIEHPELVAERIMRFAGVVGRENVIAGTDCGFSTSAGWGAVHPTIAWAKLKTLAEGARLATEQLWRT